MNSFANFISEKCIHINKTEDGKEFANISISCPKSKTGMASIAVNLGQVRPATRKDNTVVEGYKNILLGKADGERTVKIATNKKGTNWKSIKMTNQAIAEMITEQRTAYRASQKAEEAVA